MAGFFSTENKFEGDLTVCTITFTYTGSTQQTVTLNNLALFRFTGNSVGGVPELEKVTEPWTKTITVSRGATTPKAAKPTADPVPGTYNAARQVVLSCPGAQIYYTTDGTTPTRASTLYTGAIAVDQSMTIKAISVKAGYEDSDVATFTYTISIASGGGGTTPKVATPTASPAPGKYNSGIQVVLTCQTAGAEIYYTTDGTTPTTASRLYTAPISVDKTTTIKAVAVKTDYTNSGVATFTYTISAAETPEFKDVGAKYAWAKEAIGYLAARSVILGDNKGNFRPADNVTRADFVVMISRLVSLGSAGSSEGFNDVPAGTYYTEAVYKAFAVGIVNGTGGGSFNPRGNITRQDAFVILYRLLGRLGLTDDTKASLSTFGDASSVASYAQQAMEFLVGKGIVQGSGGLLNPRGNITRAEAAVILYRIAVMYSL